MPSKEILISSSTHSSEFGLSYFSAALGPSHEGRAVEVSISGPAKSCAQQNPWESKPSTFYSIWQTIWLHGSCFRCLLSFPAHMATTSPVCPALCTHHLWLGTTLLDPFLTDLPLLLACLQSTSHTVAKSVDSKRSDLKHILSLPVV